MGLAARMTLPVCGQIAFCSTGSAERPAASEPPRARSRERCYSDRRMVDRENQPQPQVARENRMKSLKDQAGAPFTSGFRGELYAPGEGGYEQARKVYNAMIDKRPGLI